MNFKSFTENKTITKFIQITQSKVSENKLHQILKHTPLRVPKLYSYGWTSDSLLILKLQFVEGVRLKEFLTSANKNEQAQIFSICKQTIQAWQLQGFVHGDLSLNNILVEKYKNTLQVWFVDWKI